MAAFPPHPLPRLPFVDSPTGNYQFTANSLAAHPLAGPAGPWDTVPALKQLADWGWRGHTKKCGQIFTPTQVTTRGLVGAGAQPKVPGGAVPGGAITYRAPLQLDSGLVLSQQFLAESAAALGGGATPTPTLQLRKLSWPSARDHAIISRGAGRDLKPEASEAVNKPWRPDG